MVQNSNLVLETAFLGDDFGLVWIEPLRSSLTIAELWDEGEGVKWVQVERRPGGQVMNRPFLAGRSCEEGPRHAATSTGGQLLAATYPVASDHRTRINEGVT